MYLSDFRTVTGELTALKKGNKLKLQQTWSPSNHNDGAVPWMHTGPKTKAWRPYPERYGEAGSSQLLEFSLSYSISITYVGFAFWYKRENVQEMVP